MGEGLVCAPPSHRKPEVEGSSFRNSCPNEMTGIEASELKQRYLIGFRMGREGSLETRTGGAEQRVMWVSKSGKG